MPVKLFISFILFVNCLFLSNSASAQNSPIDISVAQQYFQEAEKVCDRDNNKLWGLRICGPILFVDPATRMVVTNQNDLEGFLSKKDGGFVGRLPDKQPIANATLNWGGVKWAMVIWSSLSNDRFQRVKLMIHESYHRIQNDLKLPITNSTVNNHLNTLEGRIWLQLEWRALRAALVSKGKAQRQAITDALIFRKYRRSLFPGMDVAENALEMHEGLAEYTAFTLTSENKNELIENLTKYIDDAPTKRPSFISSFAYTSGPAYGVLLDALASNWRKELTSPNNLGELLGKSIKIKINGKLKEKAEIRALQYNGEALKSTEIELQTARIKKIAEYKMRLVEGPTLLLERTRQGNLSYNSSNLMTIEGFGTVYPIAKANDEWGTLEVTNGALMKIEEGRISKIYVSAPINLDERPLKGDGWTLQLNSDWTIESGLRKGDYVLKKLEK